MTESADILAQERNAMPIREYYCPRCEEGYARICKEDDKPCPNCGIVGERLVSRPGYRRDHTFLEGE